MAAESSSPSSSSVVAGELLEEEGRVECHALIVNLVGPFFTNGARITGISATWHDLASLRWVAPPRNTPVRRAFMEGFLNNGLMPPQPVVEAVFPPMLGALIRLDRSLIGLVRYGSTLDCDAFPGTRIVEIVPRISLPPLYVIQCRAPVECSEAVAMFVELLKRTARGGTSAI